MGEVGEVGVVASEDVAVGATGGGAGGVCVVSDGMPAPRHEPFDHSHDVSRYRAESQHENTRCGGVRLWHGYAVVGVRAACEGALRTVFAGDAASLRTWHDGLLAFDALSVTRCRR